MTERQYIRYEKGEYDDKDIKPTLLSSLQQLILNGPQFVRQGDAGDRISALEESMKQVMSDLYKIKMQLNIK
jgi:hypothetical protein